MGPPLSNFLDPPLPSQLWIGDKILTSAEGVQQGDPLGPLLFCLALDGPLKGIKCEFISGYLDDVSLGDTVPNLIEQLHHFEEAAASIGLTLNQSKCEVIGLAKEHQQLWESSGLKFTICSVEEASLLGSPLNVNGIDSALAQNISLIRRISPRLNKLSSHEAFFSTENFICSSSSKLPFPNCSMLSLG